MTPFTSGRRAELGLPPANHDPKPWRGLYSGTRLPDSRSVRESVRITGDFGWQPRPEFDVPDNPILAEFRALSEKHGMDTSQTATLARSWLARYRYFEWQSGVKRATKYRAHAHRVLEKLTNVYGEGA